ncbi:hypothetical protein SNEBB_005642, partial [Seison nebaliae]
MTFLIKIEAGDEREKRNLHQTALIPMIMGILGTKIFAVFIVCLVVGVSVALDDGDDHITPDVTITVIGNTAISKNDIRLLEEDEKYAKINSSLHIEYTKQIKCEIHPQKIPTANSLFT